MVRVLAIVAALLGLSGSDATAEVRSFAAGFNVTVEGMSTYPVTGFMQIFRHAGCGAEQIRRDYHIVEDKGGVKEKFTAMVTDSVTSRGRVTTQQVIFNHVLGPGLEAIVTAKSVEETSALSPIELYPANELERMILAIWNQTPRPMGDAKLALDLPSNEPVRPATLEGNGYKIRFTPTGFRRLADPACK